MVRGQTRQIVQKTPFPKYPEQKNQGVAQAVEHLLCKRQSPEFKPQTYQKKKVL
jgi:hypothetical protein